MRLSKLIPIKSIINATLLVLVSIFLTPVEQSIASPLTCLSYYGARFADIENSLAIKKTKRIIEENGFKKNRELRDYIYFFGVRFRLKLASIFLKGGHWLDAGAGSGRGQREFFEKITKIKITKNLLRLTAVSVTKPYEAIEEFSPIELSHPNQVRYLHERYIEEIPDKEIISFGRLDLITDLFGPLSYSDKPIEILNKYLRILKNDGEIYTNLGGRLKIDERSMTIVNWLKTIEGIEVSQIGMGLFGSDPSGPHSNGNVIRIRKTRSDIQIPPLRLVFSLSGTPPIQSFELAN